MRIALLLDPFSVYLQEPLSLRVKWADHAPLLARELLGRGHVVRGFGAPPGLIPRSGDEEKAGRGAKLAHFKPDVIIAYDSLSPGALRGAIMAKRLDAALILVEAALPKVGRPISRNLWRLGDRLWGAYIRRQQPSLVALDSLAREQSLEHGFPAERIEIIPYGVDLRVFRPGLTSTLVARRHIKGRILLYVGRLGPERGLDTLIAAFARTVGQRSDWNLVLAGDGPHRPRLRAQADRSGVSDRIHWMARPRIEELPGLMGASTLLAVPALDESVVGKQIGRALACGLPVLASDLPRLRAAVQHDETGLLVPAGDVEAWTEAVQRAASSPVARKRWGLHARARAERELDWAVVTERFEDAIRHARDRFGVVGDPQGATP